MNESDLESLPANFLSSLCLLESRAGSGNINDDRFFTYQDVVRHFYQRSEGINIHACNLALKKEVVALSVRNLVEEKVISEAAKDPDNIFSSFRTRDADREVLKLHIEKMGPTFSKDNPNLSAITERRRKIPGFEIKSENESDDSEEEKVTLSLTRFSPLKKLESKKMENSFDFDNTDEEAAGLMKESDENEEVQRQPSNVSDQDITQNVCEDVEGIRKSKRVREKSVKAKLVSPRVADFLAASDSFDELSSRTRKSKKRKKSDSESDFDPNNDKSLESDHNENLSSGCLLDRIDMSLPLNSGKRDKRFGMKFSSSGERYFHWIRFVQFRKQFHSREDEFDPYQSTPAHVDLFVDSAFAGHDGAETMKTRRFLYHMLGLNSKDIEEYLSLIGYNESITNEDELVHLRSVEKGHQVGNFIWYCDQMNVNPFLCSSAMFLQFYLRYCHLTCGNFEEFLGRFNVFYKSQYLNGVELKDLRVCAKILQIELALKNEILSLASMSEEEKLWVFKCTPDFRFEKYVAVYPARDFWNESVVREVLGNERHMPKACKKLGISQELFFSKYQEIFEPTNKCIVKSDFRSTEQAKDRFWNEPSILLILKNLRAIKSANICHGVFETGSSFEEFRIRFKSYCTEMDRLEKAEKLRKETNWIKTCKSLEEEDDISEYEKAIAENAKTKEEMFKSLGISKLRMKPKKVAEKSKPNNLPLRQKSVRNKSRGQHSGVHKFVFADLDETKVPAVNDLKLVELCPLHYDMNTRRRFLSCLRSEIIHFITAKESNNNCQFKNVKLEPDADNEANPVDRKKFQFSIASEAITCSAVYPDPELSVVATGYESGKVGLWINSNIASDLGRSLSFRTHCHSVHALDFQMENRNKILSSGGDGHIRSMDLITGKLDMVYKWNDHHDTLDSREELNFVQTNAHQLLVYNKHRPSPIQSLLLFDSRSSKISDGGFSIPSLGLESGIEQLFYNPSAGDGNQVVVRFEKDVFLYDLRASKDFGKRYELNPQFVLQEGPREDGAILFSSSFNNRWPLGYIQNEFNQFEFVAGSVKEFNKSVVEVPNQIVAATIPLDEEKKQIVSLRRGQENDLTFGLGILNPAAADGSESWNMMEEFFGDNGEHCELKVEPVSRSILLTNCGFKGDIVLCKNYI